MAEILNGAFRAVNTLLGLLMIAMGGIWILQGLGIAFLNSFMANQIQWSVYGALLALVGIGQVWWSNTRAGYYRGRQIASAGQGNGWGLSVYAAVTATQNPTPPSEGHALDNAN